MDYRVTIEIETVDGIAAKTIVVGVTPKQLTYLLANLPLAYSIPLGKCLREMCVNPERYPTDRWEPAPL